MKNLKMITEKLGIRKNYLCLDVVNREEINLYNFKDKGKYYDIKGKSITKSLMRLQLMVLDYPHHSNEKTSIQL